MKSAPSSLKMEKARRRDVKEIVDLIYITEPAPEEEWGYGSEQERKETLKRLMRMKNNRFSLDNIIVARKNKKLVGMLLYIEGDQIDRLTINSEKQVIATQKGWINKLGLLYTSIKDFFFFRECKEDEFYISNIAIKPEYRGKGYANIMIEKAYEIARKKGYRKASLVAKNNKLISFYGKLGFNLENRKIRRMVTNI